MIKSVTEVCPSCEREVTLEWNIEQDGFKAFCPYCGERLMLCDECRHCDGEGDCDYESKTDSCRHNPPKPERVMTNEEKIKNMSREELAEFLYDIDWRGVPCCDKSNCIEQCLKCVQNRLGKEADKNGKI